MAIRDRRRPRSINAGRSRALCQIGIVAALLVVATGCHEHVALNVPPSSADVQERMSAYERLHPLSMHETHITHLRGGAVVGATRQVDYLQLSSGERVYYPEDLMQVVDRNSPTARAAERSRSARSTSYTLTGLAIGGLVVGGGVMFMPIMQDRAPGESMNMTPLYLGAGIMFAGLVLGWVGHAFSSTANDEAATAFETFDGSLRDNLKLCVKGQSMGACQ